MAKLYAGLFGILLLGIAFWYVHKHSYQSGINAERTKWQDVEIARSKEILRLQDEIANQKHQAEQAINAERKNWEKRINALKDMVTDCMPPDVLAQLRDSGIYTGQIPCK